MFLSLFLHLFYLNQTVSEDPNIEVESAQAQMTTPPMIAVEGYDPFTDRAFAHSLPIANLDLASLIPKRKASVSLGVIPTADSAIVLDKRSGGVLYESSPDTKRSIASITKLMTALVLVDEGLIMEEVVTVTQKDYREGGRLNVYTGEEITVRDLLSVGLIASDNVAMAALMRHAGYDSESFRQAMDNKAIEIGMSASSFNEPTGINAQNQSTARDLTVLLLEVMKRPALVDIVSQSEYIFSPQNKEGERRVESTNVLFNSFVNEAPYQLLGGKTGFTFDAGYCLAVVVDGPNAFDEVVVVVLGSDTIYHRFNDVKGLVDWTYSNYEWKS